jgi:hypothetical protein
VTSRVEGRADDADASQEAARLAYARWITEQRQRVLVRVVPPLDGGAE